MPMTTTTEVPTYFGPSDSPKVVLTTLARRGTGVTVIASPDDEHDFNARGGQAALDRLRGTAQPPRLIATPIGDHSAYHPAILAAIRNAVLPELAASLSEHISVSEITSSPNALVGNRNHLATGPGTVVLSTGYTGCSGRDNHHGGGRA